MRHTPRTTRQSLQATALAGLLALGIGGAVAQTAAPAATPMNFGQVTEAVTKQGFQDIREIERKGDKLYEIEARDATGAKVELLVDARSGEVLRTETKGRGK